MPHQSVIMPPIYTFMKVLSEGKPQPLVSPLFMGLVVIEKFPTRKMKKVVNHSSNRRKHRCTKGFQR